MPRGMAGKTVGCLPQHDLEIFIDVSGEKRNISVEVMSADGETIAKRSR